MVTRLAQHLVEHKESGQPKKQKKGIRKNRLRVLNIQRTCVYDGPGIRTTIFFQGCRLRCTWCQNPESLSDVTPDNDYLISNIVEIVSRDKEYYFKTGGGVTLSGGEPLLQNPADLIPLMKSLNKEKIHIAVETALHVPWKNVDKLAPYIDLFLIDLKILGDDILHKKYTKQSNRLIHSNIKKLIYLKANVKFRMVMVPGCNDKESDIKAASEFLKSVGHHSIELLKYHNMYEGKAERLGLERELLNITNDQAVRSIKGAVNLFENYNIRTECNELDVSRNKALFPKRVYDIQNAIRDSDHSLCFEVSSLKTDFYRKNGFEKPNPIHRSERLSYVLKNKEIIVYPEELLVGNFTSKRRGSQVWEEHFGMLFATVIHQIDHQKPVPFKCTWKDKLNFYYNIFPFWLKHSLISKVYSSPIDALLYFARCSEMNTGFNNNLASIAHYIVNYKRMLEYGTTGIIKEIETKQKEKHENNKDFYEGVIIALKGLEVFANRYAESLSCLSREERNPVRRKELEEMAEICSHVPKYPARTYHEALQSMMFLHIGLCIESFENAVSPGRLDQILYPYYKRDKEAGIIDYEKAKELLALFILKMDECILVNDGDSYLSVGRLFETMSTDQTVTAGGLGKDGKDATNELTYALLDICELQPYAVNMTARIHRDSPVEYLDRLAEVYINGSPMPALYNDELYIETLQKHYDTTVEDARNYAIVGCVEPNASDDHYGNTDCANMNVVLPFLQALKGGVDDLWDFGIPDQLEKITTKFLEYNLSGDGIVSRLVSSKYNKAYDLYNKMKVSEPNPPGSMDELLERFQLRLNHLATSILTDHQKIEKVIRENFATPLASSLSKGCIANGKDVNEGGATINSSGIQAVGITDVGDSLHAINEVVYMKEQYSINDIINAIDNDFVGPYYHQIQKALLAVPKFGQDESQEAIDWVNRVLQIYVNALNQVPNCPRNGIYAAGYYALNVNDVYGKKTPSLPSGRLRGVPLANSVAPHYGMQVADLLSSLNSIAGVDFAKYAPNGTTVTFTIDSALFQGPEGVRNLSSIFSTYFKNGGMQFQPNVISREILLDAYNNPEKYPYLLVRVAGYCAYFNHLSDDLKKIIINRTCYC
ncbi:pyruvate formate lyase family protein [candidate division CSSED10-310 bacterium]|uniref:Pyruvate formate lyase family protein n=1 Tax=candidate division CSSED10-310 bacterium TaxID=2855610 RepID=A0ABV6YYL7_UNCC1